MKKQLIRIGVAAVTIFLTLALMSSCSPQGEQTESMQSRSKHYELYTEMLTKYTIGADYSDIAAYLDEIEVYYSENTESDTQPRIQLYGGQLFFTSDNKLNSITSTHWMTPDGWGAGSTLDEVEAVLGVGDKQKKMKNITYVYSKDDRLYTVTFDEHFIVMHWSLS